MAPLGTALFDESLETFVRIVAFHQTFKIKGFDPVKIGTDGFGKILAGCGQRKAQGAGRQSGQVLIEIGKCRSFRIFVSLQGDTQTDRLVTGNTAP